MASNASADQNTRSEYIKTNPQSAVSGVPAWFAESRYLAKQSVFNMVWRYSPRLAIRLRNETGRGHDDDWGIAEKFRYHKEVFDDFVSFLRVGDPEEFFQGKRVLEIGPGDSLNIGLRCLAYGAREYCAVDRFPILAKAEQESALTDLLRSDLPATQHARLDALLENCRGVWHTRDPEVLRYVQEPFETSESLHGSFDVIWSRAVLEHVKDLAQTIERVAELLAPGGVSVHKIDLDCHKMSPNGSPLWFLTVSPAMWRFIGSDRDLPNRRRRSMIVDLIEQNGLELMGMETTSSVGVEHVREVRPRLAKEFQGLDDDDLSCTGVFVSFRKRPQ